MSELLIPIKQYAKTAAQLATENAILISRQLVIESDTGKMKLGNGTTAYNSLPYLIDVTTQSRAALSFTAGSGAYNSTTGVITIPTNTNQLTNDAGFISGSGTTNYLPKFTASGTVGNSILQESSTGLSVIESISSGLRLLLTNTNASSGAFAALQLSNQFGVNSFYESSNSATGARIGTTSNHPFSIVTNNLARFYILGNGNGGIGTSNPAVTWVVSNNGLNALEIDPTTNSGARTTVSSYNRNTTTYTDLRYSATKHEFQIGSATPIVNITSSGIAVGRNTAAFAIDANGVVAAAAANGFRLESAGTSLGSFRYSGALLIDRPLGTTFLIQQNASTEISLNGSGQLFVVNNMSVGSTTFTSLFNVGNAAQFQVNSTGAIVAATGITTTGLIDVTGANGYTQLRLRTSYTPTSTADANGSVGSFAWDANYMYIKTAAGWKRGALLSTF